MMLRIAFLVLTAFAMGVSAFPGRSMPHIMQHHTPSQSNDPARPSTADCVWKTVNQTLDHFNQGNTVGHGATFSQRYCIVDRYWQKPSAELYQGDEIEDVKGPIFFYTGNESPVEEYINNTGLIWELAPKFGALVVFAEHRYEGESVPNQEGVPDCLSFCSSAQALADYASLIDTLKTELDCASSPVVAFGGSYGGMLSSWLRFKYPSAVAGAIAASAPIWGFAKTTSEVGLDGAGVAISRGVSAAGGATDMCRDNLKFSWPMIRAIGASQAGRDALAKTFRLCNPLKDMTDVNSLIAWGNAPWFNLAEGNYPFPSTYITFAVGPGLYPLPPWPMRVACSNLDRDFNLSVTGNVSDVLYKLKMGRLTVAVNWDRVQHNLFSQSDVEQSGVLDMLSAVRDAVAVWYNVTGSETCFDISNPPSAANSIKSDTQHKVSTSSSDVCTATQKGSWGPICCNDNLNLINYVTMGVGRDIFWPPTVQRGETIADIVNRPGTHTSCEAQYAAAGLYGVPHDADPWSSWMTTYYGGRTMRPHSNVVFSNGLFDPWSSAGVYGPGGYEAARALVDQSHGDVVVQNITADGSIVAVVIDEGGHHLDLFFSTPNDPKSAVQAREIEAQHIKKWIVEAYADFEQGWK